MTISDHIWSYLVIYGHILLLMISYMTISDHIWPHLVIYYYHIWSDMIIHDFTYFYMDRYGLFSPGQIFAVKQIFHCNKRASLFTIEDTLTAFDANLGILCLYYYAKHTFCSALMGLRVKFVQSESREFLLLPFGNKCRLYFRTDNLSLAITKRNSMNSRIRAPTRTPYTLHTNTNVGLVGIA
jgi:hypothetical protein